MVAGEVFVNCYNLNPITVKHASIHVKRYRYWYRVLKSKKISYKIIHSEKKLAEPDLVADGGNETVELSVPGELGDMLDEPLDHLGVPLPEGRHQAGHLPVVLAVDVCT
jgi:hypothetical protein